MKRPMKKQVRNETMRLLTENGATGWKVRFNPRLTRALGRCDHYNKVIDYQPRFMADNDWDEVVLTIRHEVAHALVPVWHDHDSVWRAKCLELGGTGKRYNTTAKLTKKFTGKCPSADCGREIQRDRRNSASCGKCSGGFYNPKYKFIWTRND